MSGQGECLVADGTGDAPGCEPVDSDVPSETLAARCQAGDQDAFGLLVRRHTDRVYAFLRRWTANTHDAEDLAQETFLKAYLGLHRFTPHRPFLPWLYAIARHTAISHLRRAHPTEPLTDATPEPEAGTPIDPFGQSAAADDLATLWELARRLKPKQYEALWLHYGEGFAVADVARVMGLTRVHVKVLLHRARARLERWLPPRRQPKETT
jgi:RNA polymerase sigma-70 factor (ECF subfamily)